MYIGNMWAVLDSHFKYEKRYQVKLYALFIKGFRKLKDMKLNE